MTALTADRPWLDDFDIATVSLKHATLLSSGQGEPEAP